MSYIKVTGGVATRYTIEHLRRDYPSHGLSDQPSAETLARYGVYPCEMLDPPAFSPTQKIQREAQPTQGSDGLWQWGWSVVDKSDDEIAADLQVEREQMVCTPMQGILALGETEWNKVLAYRDTQATWAQKVIIDSSLDWRRNSENIAFFGFLLGYTAEQMDDMFRQAMSVKV